MVTHNPSNLSCLACGQHADQPSHAGIWLRNPVDDDEFVVIAQCPHCRSCQMDVEQSGWSVPQGAEYWSRGPYAPTQAKAIIDQIAICPTPFDSWCECTGHDFMSRLMYGRFRGAEVDLPTADPAEDASVILPYLTRLKPAPAQQPTPDAVAEITKTMDETTQRAGGTLQVHHHRMDWARHRLRPLE